MSHRVIQWSTGNVGIHSLRHIIRHPGLELVGVHAHSPAKAGLDAAELCGLPEPTGVIATGDVDALLALDADAVVYTTKGETRPHEVVSELERILASGTNVVSCSMIFLIYPPHASPSLREPLEKACRTGGTTLFVSGIDPGFSGDVLPLAALQLADQVEEIRVQELVDYSTYEDPEFTGVSFGFGRPADYTPPLALPGSLRVGWGGMVRMVADALELKLDEMQETYERRYADEAFDTPMMHVPKDTCAAVRFELRGMVGGRAVVVTEHVNRLREDIAPDWPRPSHWNIHVVAELMHQEKEYRQPQMTGEGHQYHKHVGQGLRKHHRVDETYAVRDRSRQRDRNRVQHLTGEEYPGDRVQVHAEVVDEPERDEAAHHEPAARRIKRKQSSHLQYQFP